MGLASKNGKVIIKDGKTFNCCGGKPSEWTPSVFEVCEGQEFEQSRTVTNHCGDIIGVETQPAIGQMDYTWSDWTPATSTRCVGKQFTQSRSSINCPYIATPQTRSAVGTNTTSNSLVITNIDGPVPFKMYSYVYNSWYGGIPYSKCLTNKQLVLKDPSSYCDPYATNTYLDVTMGTGNYWPGSAQVGPHGNSCILSCSCNYSPAGQTVHAEINNPWSSDYTMWIARPGWEGSMRYAPLININVPAGYFFLQAWATNKVCGWPSGICGQYAGQYALIKSGPSGTTGSVTLNLFYYNPCGGENITACSYSSWPVTYTYKMLCC